MLCAVRPFPLMLVPHILASRKETAVPATLACPGAGLQTPAGPGPVLMAAPELDRAVLQSRSPVLHRYWLEAHGIAGAYVPAGIPVVSQVTL